MYICVPHSCKHFPRMHQSTIACCFQLSDGVLCHLLSCYRRISPTKPNPLCLHVQFKSLSDQVKPHYLSCSSIAMAGKDILHLGYRKFDAILPSFRDGYSLYVCIYLANLVPYLALVSLHLIQGLPSHTWSSIFLAPFINQSQHIFE